MRTAITALICFLVSTAILAQHRFNKTMFVFNKLQYNPAYAGSQEHMTLGAHYRHQWQGVLGAPRTLTAFAHTPVAENRSGLGLSITSDEIGIFHTIYTDLSYAYKIKFKNESRLSIGFNSQLEYARFDWSKADLIDQIDTSIPFELAANSTINFGLGIYYETEKFFVGASAPQLIKNTITSGAFNSFANLSPLLNYYFMGGYVFHINDNISLKPSVLISYVPNAPMEADLNLSVLFLDTFWVGASYRLEEAASIFVQVPVMKNLKLAIAADYTLSDINQFTKGSIEMMATYTFGDLGMDKVNNIRFF